MKKIQTIKNVNSKNKKKGQKKKSTPKKHVTIKNQSKVIKKRVNQKQQIIKSNILSLVQSRNKISKQKLKPGDIVRFIYSGTHFHDKNPLVLILNKNWYGKTHGIALRYLSVRQIQMLASVVMKKKSIYTHFKAIFKLSKQQTITIDNPRSFYYQKIKPFIRSTHTNIYRTYFYSKITNVQNFGFKFQKDIWKQIAIEHQKVHSGFQKYNVGYNRLSDVQYYDKIKKTGDAAQISPIKDINKKKSFSTKDAMQKLKKAGLI